MLIIPVIQVGLYPCSAWLREFRYWGFGRTAVRTACMSYWFWAVGLVSDDAEPLLEGLDGIHHLVSGNIVLPQCLGISSDATDRHVWPCECRGSWDSPRLPWNRSSEIPSSKAIWCDRARYERGSIILTSNKGFGEWGELLGDRSVIAFGGCWTACCSTQPRSGGEHPRRKLPAQGETPGSGLFLQSQQHISAAVGGGRRQLCLH